MVVVLVGLLNVAREWLTLFFLSALLPVWIQLPNFTIDKFCLALAGLTYWLRLQVVTYITGRSFSNAKEDLIVNALRDLDVVTGLEHVMQMYSSFGSNSDDNLYGFKCQTYFGVCLLSTSMTALKERAVSELDILTMVAEGFAEYFSTGDIGETWEKLREIKHVMMAAQCLKDFKICL